MKDTLNDKWSVRIYPGGHISIYKYINRESIESLFKFKNQEEAQAQCDLLNA